MKTSAESDYWAAMWEQQQLCYAPDALGFTDLFARHLGSGGGDCFEIGCYPGGYLIYLSTKHRLRAHGIDMYPGVATALPAHLARHGASVGDIVHGDFFNFTATQQYDLVCSFGFVEHFYNFQEVIRRHCALVKPGGLLIITCPNFRGVQWLLHWLLDRASLRKHVLSAMDLEAWQAVISEAGMEVVEKGWYGKFLFWVESSSPLVKCLATQISRIGARLARRLRRPHPWVSPFMFCVARRPE